MTLKLKPVVADLWACVHRTLTVKAARSVGQRSRARSRWSLTPLTRCPLDVSRPITTHLAAAS